MQPGQHPDFDLLRELGSGQHGTVWLARLRRAKYRLPVGTELAVKFLKTSLLGDEAARARFRQEAKLGLGLKHEHVIRIHALEEDRWMGLPLLYLVMEYVVGRTLRDVIQEQGGAVEELVRRVGGEACLGLAALHRASIVHRDLKPENLYLTREGKTKLMDLGFARQGQKRLAGIASSGGVHGSLAYIAPECLRGQSASASSDVYAMGLTLSELATGLHPFIGSTHSVEPDEIIRRQLEEPAPPPSTKRPRLSPFIDAAITSMLDKDPKQRPSAKDLARIFTEGEASKWWQSQEREEPLLRSERRLRQSRRPAAVPLVGRDRDLAFLERNLARARRGEVVCVHLHGPEGIGKRRLVDEFAAKALEGMRPIRYYAGEARSRSQRKSFWPLAQMLIEHYSGQDFARGALLMERLAYRLQTLGDLPLERARRLSRALLACVEGQTEIATQSFPIEAAALALRQLSSPTQALVLRIHRAERLDDLSVAVLSRLFEEPGDAGLLLILTSHVQRLPFAGESLPMRRRELRQFSRAETNDFFAQLFESPGVGLQAATALLEQQAPVPGLLLESLRVLIAKSAIEGEPGSYRLGGKELDVPVRGLLAEYIEFHWQHLSASEQRMLGAAAVLGSRFEVQDLAALLGEEELTVLTRLGPLRDEWVLSSGKRMRFKRSSQRRAILDFIGRDTRMDWHMKAAALLESRDADPLTIGMHLSRAAQHERALARLIEGARQILARGDAKACAAILKRCKLHLEQLPAPSLGGPAQLDVLELEARSAILEGRPREAQEWIERALPLARSLEAKEREAELRLDLATLAQERGHVSQALTLIDLALEGLVRGDSPRKLEALLRKAELLGLTGSLKDGLLTAVEAHDRAAKDPVQNARALSMLARFEASRLRTELAEQHFEEAELALRDLGLVSELWRCRLYRARFEMELGRSGSAERRITQALPSAEAEGQRSLPLRLEARRRNYRGDFAAALEVGQEAEAAAEAERVQSRILDARLGLLATRTELGMGRVQEAKELFEQAVRGALPRQMLLTRTLEARLLRLEGAYDEAGERIDAGLQELRLYTLEPTWILRFWRERAGIEAALSRPPRTKRLAVKYLHQLASRLPRTRRSSFLRATATRRELLS